MSHQRIHTSDRAALEEFPGGHILQKPGMKPTGLWWAVDDAWIDWAQREDYGIGANTFRLEIDSAKLLIIGRDMSLDEFDAIYCSDRTQHASYLPGHSYAIHWENVAEKYDGIEVPFYSWKHRHNFMWYYGWDIASGCLWRSSALRSWERIERAMVRRRQGAAI